MVPRLDQPSALRAGFDRRADLRVNRGIPDRALHDMGASRLELRLDQRDEPRLGGGQRQHARQHQTQRNEADVADDRRRRRFEEIGGEIARVASFVNDHAPIRAQSRRELAVADVDGGDPARAARQQNVGEAAGRSADVEAIAAARIEPERVERRLQLDAAARGPGMGGARLDERAGSDAFGRLAQDDAVDRHQPRADRRLGARAARKMAKFDKGDIGALAHGPRGESKGRDGASGAAGRRGVVAG